MKSFKLVSNAGKIPNPPEELVSRIDKKFKNKPVDIIAVVEEIEKYRKEERNAQTASVLIPTDSCRLVI